MSYIYTDHNGDHLVSGVNDIQRLNGHSFDLRPKIMTDETGQIVGIQGGEMSLEKSFGIIEGLKTQHKEEVLRKSQQSAQLKKSFKQAKPLHRSSSQQAAASFATKHAFDGLLRELDSMKHKQNQFMTKAWS